MFIYKHGFLLTAALGHNFIVDIIIVFSDMDIVHKVNSSVVSLLLFIAIPIYGITNFESWRCFHLFVENAVPVPFKKLRINVILSWRD